MIFIQGLYFLIAATVMAAAGSALLLPPVKKGAFDKVYVSMLIAFAAKLVLGVLMLGLCWKILGWSAQTSAFGMVGAYLIALIATTYMVMRTVKKGQEG